MTTGTPAHAAGPRSLLPFAILIGGQLLSFIGTTLTGIAVGMWVFTQTGSVSTFALLTVLTLLPAILISPFGGVIADKFPRKPTMLLVDSASMLSNATMLVLLATGRLETWHLFVNAAVNGLSLGMQRPLYESITPLMVPKDKLAFVNGIVQSVAGIGQVVAPVAAGLLVGLGLKWILLLDLLTFVIAIHCILFVRVPNPGKTDTGDDWFAAFAEGWRFIKERPGLHALLWFVAARNFLFAACEVAVVPLLLIITTPTLAGAVLSVGGLGIIAGGLLMGLLANSRRLIIWIILAQGLTGLAMIAGGFITNLFVIGGALALAFLAFPIEEASTTTIIQRKVPSAILGRVSSVRAMMNMSAPPFAMLLVAPLADKIFEPLMREDGALAASFGQLIGTGEGRGLALVLLLAGILTVLITLIGWRTAKLRNVESDLPDQAHETEHGAPDPAAQAVR